jgi:hypothetical protein
MDSTVIRIWTTGVINEGRQKNTKEKEGCTAIMNKSTYKDVFIRVQKCFTPLFREILTRLRNENSQMNV